MGNKHVKILFCCPTCAVRAVRNDGEYVLQYVGIVSLVKALSRCVHYRYILQHLVEDAEAGIRYVPHGVLEPPYDRVQNQFELSRRNS